MQMFAIEGGIPLQGTIDVGGSKNAVLPMMAAALLCEGPVRLCRVPRLVDVDTMATLLQDLGAQTEFAPDNSLTIVADQLHSTTAPYDVVRRMRASVCVLGPLLARFGRARVSLPGGCNIGLRPIDIHLRGLSQMGASIRMESGYVIAECDRLHPAEIDLAGPSGTTVTGTANLMMA
ncbi:MAG: UDP-N-acetylglucosamine 1-carboxyvinyltransferase, partial [Planctomycetaceae bacterium]|nr:UDP-N-acetylglucosamine 1-carboxyvinyltransferase [Planctomycetaceae bacterium]